MKATLKEFAFYVMKSNLPENEKYLENFDWTANVIVSSENFDRKSIPVITLDFELESKNKEGRDNYKLELNKVELKEFINQLKELHSRI